MYCITVQEALFDQEVGGKEVFSRMLVFTLYQTHLPPEALKSVVFLLFLAEIPLLGHLCIHMREWVSQDVGFTFLCRHPLFSGLTEGLEQNRMKPDPPEWLWVCFSPARQQLYWEPGPVTI